MTTIFTSRRLRWAVPGGVAAAVAVASLSTSVAASASGRPKLAPRTATQLLVSLQQAKAPLLSGTVVETTHLGLPDLGSALTGASGSDSDLSLQTFISGSHTLRVFYGGTDKQRVALLGQTSESDVVHNGKDLWTYSSSTRAVTHSTLSDPSVEPEVAKPSSAAGLTPAAAAQQALAAIDPTTVVTVDRTAYVANQPAYQVLLTPRDSHSLIGSVRIALDAANSVPLRVQVFAKGATSPAIEVGFTDVTFGAPDASIFKFVPPAGTTVKQEAIPFVSSDGKTKAKTKADAGTAPHSGDSTKVIGSGWTSVASMPLPQGGDNGGPRGNSTLGSLRGIATNVDGGAVITSALVTVEITNDGRVLFGPVSAADLEKVAASGQPAP
jgi:outer membrane lipoprotein-sorting protein